MNNFITVPRLRDGTPCVRINVDHIIMYDDQWISLTGGVRFSQVQPVHKLDELIRAAVVNTADLFEPAAIPVVP